MSKIKNDELDQYGAEPLEQQQFGTAGVEGVTFSHQQQQPQVGKYIPNTRKRNTTYTRNTKDKQKKTCPS